MVAILSSVCSVSWHVCVSVCSGISSIWRSYISLWLFFFFLPSFFLPWQIFQTGERRQAKEKPPQSEESAWELGWFSDPSLHKFSFLLKLNIVPGWEKSLDGASSSVVSCFFCGVWGFLRWSLWHEWFEVFSAAHLMVLAKQKQLSVVVWERKWGAGEGGSALSQCWHQILYPVKPWSSSCT